MTVSVIGAVMATELARLMGLADKDTISSWLDGKATTYIYISIYLYTYTHVCIYIYIYLDICSYTVYSHGY